MLGGFTEREGEPPDAGADLRIAVAGPAVSAAAAGVFLGMAQAVGYAGGPAVVTAGLVWLAVMNGLLAVFNMLPGAPLDGGRVLRALLWWHYDDRRRADVAAAGKPAECTLVMVLVSGLRGAEHLIVVTARGHGSADERVRRPRDPQWMDTATRSPRRRAASAQTSGVITATHGRFSGLIR